jgi:hypothetical protein
MFSRLGVRRKLAGVHHCALNACSSSRLFFKCISFYASNISVIQGSCPFPKSTLYWKIYDQLLVQGINTINVQKLSRDVYVLKIENVDSIILKE